MSPANALIYFFIFVFNSEFNSKHFNYSKLENEQSHSPVKKPTISAKPTPLAAVSGTPRDPPARPQSKPSGGSKPEVEKPLIDLSEDADHVTPPPDQSTIRTSRSTLSLFDSLCSHNVARYGNVELPRPLLTDRRTDDPFEVKPCLKVCASASSLTGRSDQSIDASLKSSATHRVQKPDATECGSRGANLSQSGGTPYYSVPPNESCAYSRVHGSPSDHQVRTQNPSLRPRAVSGPPDELRRTNNKDFGDTRESKRYSDKMDSSFDSDFASSFRPPVSPTRNERSGFDQSSCSRHSFSSTSSTSSVSKDFRTQPSSQSLPSQRHRSASAHVGEIAELLNKSQIRSLSACSESASSFAQPASRLHPPQRQQQQRKLSGPVAFSGDKTPSSSSSSTSSFTSSFAATSHLPAGAQRVFPTGVLQPNQNKLSSSSNFPRTDPTDKAFDWINDAMSDFALARAGKTSGSSTPNVAPLYDEVPNEDGVSSNVGRSFVSAKIEQENIKKLAKIMWDNRKASGDGQVRPVQRHKPRSNANRPPGRNPVSSAPQYDQVPTSVEPGDVRNVSNNNSESVSFHNYDDDDFDSDDGFDDDEFDDVGSQYDACPADAPPPLPPRDYREEQTNRLAQPEGPKIYPVVSDGRQLSHTHYFLIPPKGSGSRPNTAEVKPFRVGESGGDSDRNDSDKQYQNISFTSRSAENSGKENPSFSWSVPSGYRESPPSSQNSADRLNRTRNSSSPNKCVTQSCGAQDSSAQPRLRQIIPRSKQSDAVQEDARQITRYPRQHGGPPAPPSQWASHAQDIIVSQSDRSGGGQTDGCGGGTFMSSSPRERLAQVQSSVLGVTDEECHTALCHTHWDTQGAVRYLQVEQLFRLGLASRDHCERLLEALHWNLELASSVMLDEVRGSVQCESTV